MLHCRFGLLRVRSPLLAQSLLFSFPPGTEMFQFPGFAPAFWPVPLRVGCPIRKSTGMAGICPLPWLIAACHVLLRFQEPKASFMCPSFLSFFLLFVELTSLYSIVYNSCFVTLETSPALSSFGDICASIMSLCSLWFVVPGRVELPTSTLSV